MCSSRCIILAVGQGGIGNRPTSASRVQKFLEAVAMDDGHFQLRIASQVLLWTYHWNLHVQFSEKRYHEGQNALHLNPILHDVKAS